MTYIVSGSTTRKEFETISEALEHRGDAGHSIYVTDAFGNATELSELKIRELLNEEKRKENIVDKTSQPPDEKVTANKDESKQTEPKVVDVNINIQKPSEKEDPLKNIIYYAMWIIIVALAGIIFYHWILPAIINIINIFNRL